MSIIPLTYLPKKHKVTPFTNHKLKTFRNVADSDTFVTFYSSDVKMILDNISDEINEFLKIISYNGIVVIKIMLNNLYGRNEIRTQQFFKQNPHRNIVNGTCNFIISCCPVNWSKNIPELEQHQCWMCNIDSYLVIVQDYIDTGNLFSNYNNFNYKQWKSVLLQNLFAVFELFEKYKFTYRHNWKSSNILLQKTSYTEVVYNAFEREWIVKDTYGLSPVFTDFSRSSFYYKDYYYLAREICYCIDMYGKFCNNRMLESYCTKFSILIGEVTKLDTIIEMIDIFIKTLDKY
jgi:hypothetical protein